MSVSFKAGSKATGLRSVGNPHRDVDIKWKGKVVAHIYAPTWQTEDGKWSISLAFKKEKTKEEPAPWQWMSAKQHFDSEDEARDWAKKNLSYYADRLYSFED